MVKKLIVCDPREIELSQIVDIYIQQRNGSDAALLLGLQHIILKEGWEDKAYMAERLEGYEAYAMHHYTLYFAN